MDLFAHNGVDHATSAEAVSHSLTSVILTVLLVSLTVGLLLAGITYLLKKFSLVEIPIKEDKE